MRKWLLKQVAHLCLRYHRKILVVFLVLLGVAFLVTGKLRFDPDFLKLFPAEGGPIKLYLEHLKETGTFDLLFVLVEGDQGVEPQHLIETGKKIAEGLRGLDIKGERAFKTVRFQRMEEEDLEGIKPLLSLFLSHPYLFLEEKDIPILKEKWQGAAIAQQVRKNKRLLVSHASFAMKDLVQIDPFEMRWLLMERWGSGMRGMEFDESSNFFLSKDRHSLLIIGEPARPATDFSFSKSLIEAMDQTLLPLPPDRSHRTKISFTGAHPIALSEARTLRFDMQSSFLTSLVLVLVLFFFAYRRWVTLLFAGLPLLGGIQFTMGIASLTLGSVNILTTAFSAILVGLGIDFSIHLYDRYHHERALGADIPSAIETCLTQTGQGIWTGAFTTIFAFAILYFSRVRGIVELAFLVSVGLLCLLICTFFVLPSFLAWIDQRKKPYLYQPLRPLGQGSVSSSLEKKTSLFFFGLIGVTVVFSFFASRIELERTFRNLRPKEIPSLEVLDRINKAFGGGKMEVLAVHEGKDLTQLLTKEEDLAKTLRRYREERRIDSFTSLSDFIPSQEKQGRVARVIRESIDLQGVRRHFVKSLTENGFEVAGFQHFIESLRSLGDGNERIFQPEVLISSLEQSPLKRGIEHLLKRRGDTYTVVSHLYYQKGKLSLDQLGRELSGISITGSESVESEILRIVKEDLFLLTPVALLLIFLIVFLDLRAWRTTLMTLAPLVMGMTWLIGAMSLFGIRIHFVNAVVLPMIIGMGIDNGVHLMHRYQEDRRKDVGYALRTTGRPMILCSLTTMIGFGSLVTARYQALSTMGWITILGMGFCLITSLCFLPVLLILTRAKHDENQS